MHLFDRKRNRGLNPFFALLLKPHAMPGNMLPAQVVEMPQLAVGSHRQDVTETISGITVFPGHPCFDQVQRPGRLTSRLETAIDSDQRPVYVVDLAIGQHQLQVTRASAGSQNRGGKCPAEGLLAQAGRHGTDPASI